MPDEKLVIEIENILNEVINLGAARERTRLGPNLLVTDAAPANLSNYITVQDDRDGTNILALKVPGVIYNTNDLVNVLFVEGSEAIAFQQGNGSSSSGIWSIVASTSTDIYYNSGDVGIGKAIAPDARLEVLDAAQAQLRLTNTEDVDFTDFTVDGSGNILIDPSGSGQVQLNADLLMTAGTQNFLIGDRGAAATIILEGQTSGQGTILEIFTQDGDGTDAAGLTIYGVATSADTTNRERLLIRNQTTVSYDIFVEADGTGTLRPLLIYTEGNTNQLRIDTDGFVGVNVDPVRRFHVDDSGRFPFQVSSTDAGALPGPIFEFYRDSASPLANDDLGELRFLGNNDGGGSDSYAIIRAIIADPSAGAEDGRLALLTTNSSDASKIRALIDEDGNIRMETDVSAVAQAQLHVYQSGASDAEPVILLQQEDVSEEFVRFIGTAAAATLTQSIVAEGDVSTATRQGFVKVFVQDDGNQITDQAYFMPIFTLA